MAAEDPTDLQSYQHELNQKMLGEFTSLAHKHASVSYAVLAVLVLVLSMVGLGGYYGLKSYQSSLDKAAQVEQQYHAVLAGYQQQLAADQAERVKLEDQIAQRDRQLDKKKKEVATNTTDPIKAIDNLDEAYHGALNLDPTPVEPDGKLGFNIPTVNTFTQTKLDADVLAVDKADLQNEVSSLKLDVTKGQEALKACDSSVDAYKKAAKKSKWSKVISGMKIGAAIALSAFIGHAI